LAQASLVRVLEQVVAGQSLAQFALVSPASQTPLPQADILTQVPTLLAYLQTIPAQQLNVEVFCALFVVPLIYVVLQIKPSALHDVVLQSVGQLHLFSPGPQMPSPHFVQTDTPYEGILMGALDNPVDDWVASEQTANTEFAVSPEQHFAALGEIPVVFPSVTQVEPPQSAGQLAAVSLLSQIPLPQTGVLLP
jgi:hypothetical protein